MIRMVFISQIYLGYPFKKIIRLINLHLLAKPKHANSHYRKNEESWKTTIACYIGSLSASELPGRLHLPVKYRLLGLSPTVSDSEDMECDSQSYIFNKF